MSIPDVVEALRGVQFLHDVDEEQLLSIAAIAALEEYPSGFVLFRAGQPHQNVYLVVRGIVALEVRVASQVIKRLQTVGEGELLGWSPMLGRSEMTATARTLKPTQVVAIDAPQLVAFCEHDPMFGFEIMRRTARALARRLNATHLQLLDVYSHEMPAVVAGEEI
jgi:CRP/FNR family cyclic AMP-dependent transcriptional regulator